MLRQVLESDPLWYQPYPASGSYCDVYHQYLREPPRVYDESIAFLVGLFTSPREHAGVRYDLTAIAAMDFVCWPSWRIWVYRIDPYTGAVIERYESSNVGTLQIDRIAQARDGSLWERDIYGDLWRRDAATLARSGDTYPSGYWDGATPDAQRSSFTIDRAQNLALLKTNAEANDQVGVYALDTGAVVRRIGVAGRVQDIAPEDERRAWVISEDGVMTLVDYLTGEVLSVTRQPIQPDAIYSLTAWDRHLRRLLTLERTPDAADGAGTTRVRGYWPHPVAVGLTAPLPLTAPRKGRETPILTHAYGDAGEPISGVRVAATATAPGRLRLSSAGTDGAGDARFPLAGDDAGDTTIEVSATT